MTISGRSPVHRGRPTGAVDVEAGAIVVAIRPRATASMIRSGHRRAGVDPEYSAVSSSSPSSEHQDQGPRPHSRSCYRAGAGRW